MDFFPLAPDTAQSHNHYFLQWFNILSMSTDGVAKYPDQAN
jgi:hypothetical protein